MRSVLTDAMSPYWVLLPAVKPDSQDCVPALLVHSGVVMFWREQ